MRGDLFFMAGSITGIVIFGAIVWHFNPPVTDAEIAQAKAKYGCRPTNEFVGKYAERLYICADGLKYKGTIFWKLAKDMRK